MRFPGNICWFLSVYLLATCLPIWASQIGDCKDNLLKFPQSPRYQQQQEALPSRFKGRALPPGLSHLVGLSKNAKKVVSDGRTVFHIDRNLLDARQFLDAEKVSFLETIMIPEDIVSAEELESFGSKLEEISYKELLQESREIPVLEVEPLTSFRLHGYPQELAVTDAGQVVMLDRLPIRSLENSSEKVSAAVILSGLQSLSDAGVIPELLGVSRKEDGSWMAVFPILAGFENTQLTMFKVGLSIATGQSGGNVPEPFEQEYNRIHPFESLVQSLKESQWPMFHRSIDLSALIDSRPDIRLADVFEQLRLPLWEHTLDQDRKPILLPVTFALAESWLPTLQPALEGNDNERDLFIETMSNDNSLPFAESLIRSPLEYMDPVSVFGRITILRYSFFVSLLNRDAKIEYLDLLKGQSVDEQEALIRLVEFFAREKQDEKYLNFLASYQSRNSRPVFQVIDGSLAN